MVWTPLPGRNRRRQGQAAPRVLIALTNDPALSRAVQELVASGIEVGIVQTAQALSDELVQHASAIALIDCATVDAPIEALVDAICQHSSPTCDCWWQDTAPNRTCWPRASRGKPFSASSTSPLPRSASSCSSMPSAGNRMRRAPACRTANANPFGAKPAKARATPGAGLGGGSKSRLTGIGIGIGIVLAIALGVWLFWPKGGKPGAQPGATPVASSGRDHRTGWRTDRQGGPGVCRGSLCGQRWQQRCGAVPRCIED